VTLIHGVGSTLIEMGRAEEALPYLERAVAMARATLPPGDRRLGMPIGALGAALLNLERYDAARPFVAEQLAIYQAIGEPSMGWADALYNLGNIETRTEHCDAAKAPLEQAIAMYRAIGKGDSKYVTWARETLDECR
jgi:tetratricopeptide (TPR) repeat protein